MAWWSKTDSDGAPKYSDHQPLIGHHVLSWNILDKCWLGKNRTNNGFGYSETAEEYKSRLKRIAHKIAQLVTEHNLDVIHLQEVPVSDDYFGLFSKYLRELLGDRFYIDKKFLHKISDHSGCFTIFNKAKYIGSNVTALHDKHLGEQQGRVLFSQLTERQSSQTFIVANGHFASRRDHEQAIEYCSKNQISFAGDLNAPAKEVLSSCKPIYINCDSLNFSFNVKKNGPFRTTQYDAITIFSSFLIRDDIIFENDDSARCDEPDLVESSIVSEIMRKAMLKPDAIANMMAKEILLPALRDAVDGEFDGVAVPLSEYSTAQPMYQSYSSASPSPLSRRGIKYQAILNPQMNSGSLFSSKNWQHLMKCNLLTKSADDFLSFRPSSGSSMAEFHFSSKDAAEMFLRFLIQNGIITNTNKQIHLKRQNDSICFYALPLGNGELDRLNRFYDSDQELLAPRKRTRHKY